MKKVLCFIVILLLVVFNLRSSAALATYNEGLYSYYLPGFISGGGSWTGMALSNDCGQSCDLEVLVFDKDGICLVREEKSLPAGGQTSFPVLTELERTGWIYINSQLPLNGLAFMATGIPPFMADIPFVSDLMMTSEIPHIAQDSTWDTTIFICNPHEDSVTIILKNITETGEINRTYECVLLAKGSLSASLASIFTEENNLKGKIMIVASKGVAAFALYSNTKSGGNYFAGINAVKSQIVYDGSNKEAVDLLIRLIQNAR